MSKRLEPNIILALKLFVKGVVSSPNYPGNYPDNLRRTEIIEVEEGLIVEMHFTAFDVDAESTCNYDHVTIKNGDGTTLMEKTCGFLSDEYDDYDYGIVIGGETGSSLPAAVTSTSNIVEIYFHTDRSGSYSGWRLTWRAVTPGA